MEIFSPDIAIIALISIRGFVRVLRLPMYDSLQSWIYQPVIPVLSPSPLGISLTLFLLGWFAARVLPRTLPPPRSKTPLVPHWAMDRARFALALFPILLAAVAANHLGNVHEKLKLAPGHLPGTKQAFAQTRA